MAVVLTGVSALAARGGVVRSLRSADAYFCTNKVLCQLAQNNFFTLMHAAKVLLTDISDETEYYSFPPVARAAEVTSRHAAPARARRPWAAAANPVVAAQRHAVSPRRDLNVVILLMESMAGRPVGALGHKPSFTPELDDLVHRGGLSGPPVRRRAADQPGHDGRALRASGRQRRVDPPTRAGPGPIPHACRRSSTARGYATMMIYGGDPDFDNMRGFFSKAGIEQFIDERRLGDPRQIGNWGVPDEARLRQGPRALLPGLARQEVRSSRSS